MVVDRRQVATRSAFVKTWPRNRFHFMPRGSPVITYQLRFISHPVQRLQLTLQSHAFVREPRPREGSAGGCPLRWNDAIILSAVLSRHRLIRWDWESTYPWWPCVNFLLLFSGISYSNYCNHKHSITAQHPLTHQFHYLIIQQLYLRDIPASYPSLS